MPAIEKINLYIGTTAGEKERRVAALNAIAVKAGFNSISAWLIDQADSYSGELEVLTIEDFTKVADDGRRVMDFARGYEAYRRERQRVGVKAARQNLVRLVAQYVVGVTGSPDPREANNVRQIELIVNAFNTNVKDRKFLHFHPREVSEIADEIT